ncbi:MAG: DEAD/DEAH box helicase family protein [Blastocatellia bacterium]
MKSINFEFLRKHRPELASLGGFAEEYAYPDPSSALVKLRDFVEQIVLELYSRFSLSKPFNASLYDLINDFSFRNKVPSTVVNKLDMIRKPGNKAAHGSSVKSLDVLQVLPEAYDLARWLYITFYGGKASECPAYVTPTGKTPSSQETEQLKKERQEILEKLASQEAKLKEILDQLEKERGEKQILEKTAAELEQLVEAGIKAEQELLFDEATTRKRLIDTALAEAGWNVGENKKSTDEVGQEILVEHLPTSNGIGYADYVLWGDDGKPLAVIEAKKTAKSAQDGQTQAQNYADGLEKMYGQRPVIFYTNGLEIYILNDAQKEAPRPIYGFYEKESLKYLIFQRNERKSLRDDGLIPRKEITDRIYQIEAIQRVKERFADNHRKALIVQATGTGKTRVAISLCEILVRARWVKRILFLCDRRELRKQADGVFKEFLPGEPRTYVTSSTYMDKDKRIYLATYPAMMKCYESFDIGFFDLIIADESHRSIYNRYKELFLYFDCLQVGLTATPRDLVSHNTYKLFNCNGEDPTFFFSYQEAVEQKYLVPFQVRSFTTEFQRKGIKYSQMSKPQQQQLEEDMDNAEVVEFDAEHVDRHIFNKDTNRHVLKNLMENGIRESTDSRPGKTIIFARNHNHAILLQDLFNEMYPNYGGNFCRVIDVQDDRAEQLIDDFKDKNNPLTIAISVDMLDTGIDVPEVVNLVFAKPVKSKVKFWQMIGRGTRLCPNLFGPGKDKTHFMIFDHWQNFEYFEEQYAEAEIKQSKSLLQVLFESRIRLIETALEKKDETTFNLIIELLSEDLAALPEKTIAIKEKWRELKSVRELDTLKAFSGVTKTVLARDIAPLMQWRNTRGHEEAYYFDLLIARLQNELLRKSAKFEDFKDELLFALSQLPTNINQVREKLNIINQIKVSQFWETITIKDLENIRIELRGIMEHRRTSAYSSPKPLIIDVAEDRSKIEQRKVLPKLEGLELVAYRQRVKDTLEVLIEESTTLQKIKSGIPVNEDDLQEICSLILTQNAELDCDSLVELYPEAAGDLIYIFHRIIGWESTAVRQRFEQFVQEHNLSAKQIKFLDLVINFIAKHGSIEIERLYESPFTFIDSDGVNGVFSDKEINQLLSIINSFKPSSIN